MSAETTQQYPVEITPSVFTVAGIPENIFCNLQPQAQESLKLLDQSDFTPWAIDYFRHHIASRAGECNDSVIDIERYGITPDLVEKKARALKLETINIVIEADRRKTLLENLEEVWQAIPPDQKEQVNKTIRRAGWDPNQKPAAYKLQILEAVQFSPSEMQQTLSHVEQQMQLWNNAKTVYDDLPDVVKRQLQKPENETVRSLFEELSTLAPLPEDAQEVIQNTQAWIAAYAEAEKAWGTVTGEIRKQLTQWHNKRRSDGTGTFASLSVPQKLAVWGEFNRNNAIDEEVRAWEHRVSGKTFTEWTQTQGADAQKLTVAEKDRLWQKFKAESTTQKDAKARADSLWAIQQEAHTNELPFFRTWLEQQGKDFEVLSSEEKMVFWQQYKSPRQRLKRAKDSLEELKDKAYEYELVQRMSKRAKIGTGLMAGSLALRIFTDPAFVSLPDTLRFVAATGTSALPYWAIKDPQARGELLRFFTRVTHDGYNSLNWTKKKIAQPITYKLLHTLGSVLLGGAQWIQPRPLDGAEIQTADNPASKASFSTLPDRSEPVSHTSTVRKRALIAVPTTLIVAAFFALPSIKDHAESATDEALDKMNTDTQAHLSIDATRPTRLGEIIDYFNCEPPDGWKHDPPTLNIPNHVHTWTTPQFIVTTGEAEWGCTIQWQHDAVRSENLGKLQQLIDKFEGSGKYNALYIMLSIIAIESSGHYDAVSHASAVGLGGVVSNSNPDFPQRPDTSSLLDPTFNIDQSIETLMIFLNAEGSLYHAVRRYHGPDNGYARTIFELNDILTLAQQ